MAAFKAKDVEAIMKNYAPGQELVVFDVIPPRQYVGFDAYKRDWEEFFASFPGPIEQFELTDLSIATDGNSATRIASSMLSRQAKMGRKCTSPCA